MNARAGVLALALACGGSDAARPAPGPAPTPRRIASQTVLADEILWDLGPEVRERVIAVSRMADDPRYSAVAGQWPETVPRVGGGAEALLARGPDLALVASFTAVETRRLLAGAGVRMMALDGLDGFSSYVKNVRMVAEAAGATDAGETVVAAFEARRAAIEARRGAARPTVLSFDEGDIAGAHTTFDDAAGAAGLENLARLRGVEGHGRLDIERLIAWDPPYLVVPCGERDCAEVEREVSSRPGVSLTTAAREGRVIGIESAILYGTGRTMLDLAERLQERTEAAR